MYCGGAGPNSPSNFGTYVIRNFTILYVALALGIAASAFPANPAKTITVQNPGAQLANPQRRDVELEARRRQAWNVVTGLNSGPDGMGIPSFKSWHRAEEIFGQDSADLALRRSSRTHAGEAEVIIATYYNQLAYRHIRDNRLNTRAALQHMRRYGAHHSSVAENRTIPPLPDGSAVALTVWWPANSKQVTAMPVWDPELNPARRGGNSYISWQRAVGIDPAMKSSDQSSTSIAFAGRSHRDVRRVALNDFHYARVDQAMADAIMRNSQTRKAALIALGRRIEADDLLVLVAMHVAVKESDSWTWATLWWHDHPDRGPFATERPKLAGAWRNYLLDVAPDATDEPGAPFEPCFNPWLEARFPDGGSGGGIVSNCIACHQRASYPAASFLPITSTTPDLEIDPAFAPAQLRTDFLWSIARQHFLPIRD